MEINLSIDPSDPLTIFVFIFLGLGGQLWVAWFIRQMTLDDEAPALATQRILRVLLAAAKVFWGLCYLYWIGLGIAYFISALIAGNENGISNHIYILGIFIQAIAIIIWGIKYVRRVPVDIPKLWTWGVKEGKDIWVVGFSILVDEMHLLLGFGFVIASIGQALSGDVNGGIGQAAFGIPLMISGYLVIKLGKAFEKGISWSCVVFGIGILTNYLLRAILRENFEVLPFNLGVGVLDVTHGLIGTGILSPKKMRDYLRIVTGDIIEYWALATIGTSIFSSDGITLAIGIGVLAQAWGVIVGGRWIYLAGIIWGIGLLPVGIAQFGTEIISLFISIAMICVSTFMFHRQSLIEKEIRQAYQKYVDEFNRKEMNQAEQRPQKARRKK
jgi:hypothetical protein